MEKETPKREGKEEKEGGVRETQRQKEREREREGEGKGGSEREREREREREGGGDSRPEQMTPIAGQDALAGQQAAASATLDKWALNNFISGGPDLAYQHRSTHPSDIRP